MAQYAPDPDRYDGRMPYRRCGRWGLKLPAVSLGCWYNFGGDAATDNQRRMIYTAFDAGITHIDLANNYGPPYGTAEINVGKILRDLPRDELIVSTKAGYDMWPGPYGEFGSRKYLLASLDQSLTRLGLDYVDLFYSHRFDPDTPLDETMGALDTAVRQGKALYAGISSYTSQDTRQAVQVCRENGLAVPVIHQPNYSLFNRWIEKSLLDATAELGMGVIAFASLFQGLLTDKYVSGIPAGSRATFSGTLLRGEELRPEVIDVVRRLNEHARQRGQTLAQMALAWVLRDDRVTSVVIGASRPQHIQDCVQAVKNTGFSRDELEKIDRILASLRLPDSLWRHD
jgi:L-glyceraldehyde 3-phosphate reductase